MWHAGPDYRAPNVTLDAGLNRPARYHDFSCALHLLLMIYGRETPKSVVEFTPHGFRHVQATAGAPLAAQGVVKNEALEALGHWEKGSKMPARYDAASCVTELQTRKTITDVLKTGWRPAEDGSLPVPATPAVDRMACPSTPITAMVAPQIHAVTAEIKGLTKTPEVAARMMVLNTQRKKLHLVAPPSTASMCGWWRCGTAAEPARNAVFGIIGGGAKCTRCFSN